MTTKQFHVLQYDHIQNDSVIMEACNDFSMSSKMTPTFPPKSHIQEGSIFTEPRNDLQNAAPCRTQNLLKESSVIMEPRHGPKTITRCPQTHIQEGSMIMEPRHALQNAAAKPPQSPPSKVP